MMLVATPLFPRFIALDARIFRAGPASGNLVRLPTQATLLPRTDRGRTDQRRW